MIIKFLKTLKNWTDPNYWGQRLGEKTGAFEKAENSKFKKWVDSLEGWKWWAWQLGPGLDNNYINRDSYQSNRIDNATMVRK